MIPPSTVTKEQSTHLLVIYLTDHHAASMGGLTLARRCCKANLGSPLGATLAEIIEEIEDERAALVSVMQRFGAQPSRLKLGATRLGVEASRLKLNGSAIRRSPLSTVMELEGLIAGIQAKRRLWEGLAALLGADTRATAEWTYRALSIQAESQHDRLVPLHREATRTAFEGAAPVPSAIAAGQQDVARPVPR